MPQKARILLVDDRAENLIALEAILSSLNQQLVPVRSGEAALKALLADEFAVILLDVVMPGMDGFETAAHIKRRARTHDVPIIFLTAAGAEPDHAFRGYAAGAVDYIAKPFDPWVLRAKVAVFVDLYMKNRQLREQAELLSKQAETALGGAPGGLLAELSRRLSAVEITAAGLASLPVVKTDAALADGLVQLDRGVGRLRDTLDAMGAELALLQNLTSQGLRGTRFHRPFPAWPGPSQARLASPRLPAGVCSGPGPGLHDHAGKACPWDNAGALPAVSWRPGPRPAVFLSVMTTFSVFLSVMTILASGLPGNIPTELIDRWVRLSRGMRAAEGQPARTSP